MKRITFKKFAGVKIHGKVKMDIDSDFDKIVTHPERAAWLTAMVESNGKYGSVMNYDGTGITAGIHQAVAVYPRMLSTRGSLWHLLEDIQTALISNSSILGHKEFIELQEAFLTDGYEFCLDGYLRNRKTGRRAGGKEIRNLLTGDSNGLMPSKGPGRDRCEKYVNLFHDLFSIETTFPIQNNFGMKHFNRIARQKMRFSKTHNNSNINEFVYKIEANKVFLMIQNELDNKLDLAMSMFWSHSVNAPGQALKLFCKVADISSINNLAWNLIRKLGNSKYGRWDDDLKNGRYQRTRRCAQMIWPKELFKKDEIMPKDLKG